MNQETQPGNVETTRAKSQQDAYDEQVDKGLKMLEEGLPKNAAAHFAAAIAISSSLWNNHNADNQPKNQSCCHNHN